MVGVDKPTATGTGTRVGVARVKAEWQGWCDAVLEYLHCTGAIPSHRDCLRAESHLGQRVNGNVTVDSTDGQPALMREAVPAVWGDGVLGRLTPFPKSGAAYYFRALCLGQECPSSLYGKTGCWGGSLLFLGRVRLITFVRFASDRSVQAPCMGRRNVGEAHSFSWVGYGYRLACTLPRTGVSKLLVSGDGLIEVISRSRYCCRRQECLCP